jgi:HK97 family phage portal protein
LNLLDPYGRQIEQIEGLQERTNLSEAAHAFLRGVNLRQDNASVAPETAFQRQTWVFACVTAIARIVSSIPYRIIKAGTTTDASPDDPIVDLFGRPAARKSRYDLWFATIAHLELAGNAYWHLGFGPRDTTKTKAPLTIKPLNPRWIKHTRDKETLETLAYVYTNPTTGARKLLMRDEVLQFKYFNPNDDEIGLAPLEAAMSAVTTDIHADTYNKNFFVNSAQPGALLLHKRPLTKVQMEQIRTAFEEEYGGVQQSHRTAVLSGDWNYQQVGLGHADMQYLEQRRFSREQIAGVFGVPGILINDPNNSNYSTASVEMRLFAEANWLPKVRYIEDVLRSQFFRRYAPKLTGGFDLREAPGLREEMGVKIDRAVQLGGLGVPLNDLKKLCDLPLPDYAWGNTHWIPISMVPANPKLAEEMQVQMNEPDTAPIKDQAEKKNPAGKVTPAKKQPSKRPPAQAKSVAHQQRAFYWRGMSVAAKRLRAPMQSRIERYCDDQIAALPDDGRPDISLSLAAFQSRVAPVVAAVLDFGGQMVASELRAAVIERTATNDDHLLAALIEAGGVAAKIKPLIESAATVGEAREVLTHVRSRAGAIAEFFVSRFLNQSRFVAMTQLSVSRHVWVASRSANGCDHAGLDGEAVAVGDEFSNGQVLPGQSSNGSTACSCVTVPVAQ